MPKSGIQRETKKKLLLMKNTNLCFDDDVGGDGGDGTSAPFTFVNQRDREK